MSTLRDWLSAFKDDYPLLQEPTFPYSHLYLCLLEVFPGFIHLNNRERDAYIHKCVIEIEPETNNEREETPKQVTQ
jgi:hypothetical protein